MKKLILSILLVVLSLPVFAETPEGDHRDSRKSEYLGKVSIVTPTIGLNTVHGAYFPSSRFFIGGSASSFLFGEVLFSNISVHPEWYFSQRRKVDWSIALDVGVGKRYNIPGTLTDNGKEYYRPGCWENGLDFNFVPSIGMAVKFSEKIALDIALRVEYHDDFRGYYWILTPMLSVGVRF